MYNAEYVDLLKNNEVHNIDVVIEFMDSDLPDLHNEDILDGDFHIEKSICSGDAMRFRTVTASELKFSLMYSDRKYIGQKIRVYMYLNDDPMKTFLLEFIQLILTYQMEAGRQLRLQRMMFCGSCRTEMFKIGMLI